LADQNKASPRAPRKRLRRWLLYLFLLLLLALLLHAWWLPPALELLGPWGARHLAGLEIEIEDVRSADLGHVEVTGLRVRDLETSGKTLRLDAADLEVEFSLLPLLRGDLSALASIHSDGIRLELGLDGDSPPPPEGTSSSALELPAVLPGIDISGAELLLRLGDQGRVSASRISLDTDATGTVHLEAGDVEVHSPATRGPLFHAPSLELSTRWSSRAAEALALTIDRETILSDSTVDLSGLEQGTVSFDLVLSLAGGRSGIRTELDSQGARWEMNLVGLDLHRVTPLLPSSPPLHGRLDLESRGRLAWADPAAASADLVLELDGFRGFDRKARTFTCRASAADRTLSIRRLELLQTGNRIELREAAIPLDHLDIRELLRSAEGELHGEITELTAITGTLDLPEGGPREIPEHRLELDARLTDGTLKLAGGSLESTGGRLELESGEVRLPLDPEQHLELELESRADITRLDQLGLLFGHDDWAGRLRGRVAVTGRWPHLDGRLSLDGERVRFGTMELGEVAVDLLTDEESIVVRRLKARSGEILLEGSGTYRHETSTVHDARLSLAVERIESWIGGDLLAGSLSAEVTASGPLDELQLSGTAAARDLQLADIGIQQASLRIEGTGRSFRIDELHGESIFGRLDAAASLELAEAGLPAELHLESFSLRRDEKGLSLESPCLIHLEEGGGTVDDLRLAGEAGRLDLFASWSGTGAECQVEARDLHPDLFLAGTPASIPKLASADLTGSLSWTPEALLVETSGELHELLLPRLGRPIDLRWRVDQRTERLELTSLELTGEGVHLTAQGSLPIHPFGEEPLGPGELSLRLDADLPLALLAGEGFEGTIEAGGQIGGSWTALEGSLKLEGRELQLPEELIPPDFADGRVVGEIRLDSGLFVDELGVHLGDLVDARAHGQLSTELDLVRWIADPRQLAEEARVQGKLTVASFDITRLEPILAKLGETAEQLRGGAASGFVEVEGPLLDPELRGELEVHEGLMRLGSGMPTADRLEARLLFDGTNLEIGSLTGDLGGAPFTLTGSADLSGHEPALAFHLEGTDLLLFRSREAKVRADTDLELTGPLSALVAKGKVELTDGRFEPSTDFLDFRRGSSARGARGFQLFRLRDAPLRDLSFDIELSARESFRISNTVVKGSVRPDLHLSGTGLVPVLTGTVYLERTLMKLPSTSLELTSGTVLFRPESPFLPEVEAQGRTRMLGYSIKAAISGPFDSPEIMLTSTPPMNQENLLLLVLTGRLPNDPDQTDPLATVNTVALYVATDTLARWFTDEGPMNEDSLANRFEFVSGREVSRSGVESVEVAFRITNKEGIPEERRDNRHLYLAAERDEYEFYNYGLRLVFRLR